MVNKQAQILQYLLDGKSLTVKGCQELFGTTELRKAISVLKRKGFAIVKDWECGIDRNGNPTHYKRYSIDVKQLPF